MKRLLLILCVLSAFVANAAAQETRCVTEPSSAYQAAMDQTVGTSVPITVTPRAGMPFTVAAMYRHNGQDANARRHYALMLSSIGDKPRFTDAAYHELVMIADGTRTPLGPGHGSPTFDTGKVRETVVWALDEPVFAQLASAKAVSLTFGLIETTLTPCDLARFRALTAAAK